MKTPIWFPLLLMPVFAFASGEIKNFPQVGDHYRVFLFEKNENPQNKMAIYTKLDPDCHFSARNKSEAPVLDFYWLMQGQDYKPVHPLIKSGIRDRIAVVTESTAKHRDSFFVKLSDLKKLNQDLADPSLEVKAEKGSSGCEVEALLKLGPSDGNRQIKINTIYSESKKTFFPPFRKVVAVTLKGVDVANGKEIERTYKAK